MPGPEERDYSEYIAAWRRRIQRERQALRERPEQAHADAPRVAPSLAKPEEKGYEEYIAGWRQRIRRERQELKERQERAQSDARRIAQFLAERYGVRRVILFGSLARGQFRFDSDIDLAVEGLAPARFFRALADTVDLTDIPVDLKPLEDCQAFILERIQQEGVVLYEV